MPSKQVMATSPPALAGLSAGSSDGFKDAISKLVAGAVHHRFTVIVSPPIYNFSSFTPVQDDDNSQTPLCQSFLS